ncbi:putative transposable element [Trichonephila clavipes]|nr:putative transposable element [Trichonephila clavipes]
MWKKETREKKKKEKKKNKAWSHLRNTGADNKRRPLPFVFAIFVLPLLIHPRNYRRRRQSQMNNEVHFWLDGYVNTQNCRIWSEANPQVYVETPLHPVKLTVRCALWAGGIIGPYFFKNDEGHNVTVNGDRYRAMITNFFNS